MKQCIETTQDIDNIVFRCRVLGRQLSTWLGAYGVAKSLRAEEELLNEIIDKILRVVKDCDHMIRVFFGDEAADGYFKLSSEYAILFISLIDSLVEGELQISNEIIKQIYENVGERAAYLSQVNPYWNKGMLEKYLYNFTEMTIRQINAFMSEQYKESFDIYDRVLSYSTSYGNFLAEGVKSHLTYST
ncbi:MAG: hypothetical protein ACK5MV_08735 [Aminipila sp.]